MTSFAKRHQAEIEQVRAQLEAEDPWPGLWVAERAQRLAAYQACYEEAAEHKNSGHAQWVMAKAHVLSSVAEELGQLPGRGAVVVVPVQHVLVGVDLDALT
jgi:methionyl-tRNA formyltransferase